MKITEIRITAARIGELTEYNKSQISRFTLLVAAFFKKKITQFDFTVNNKI